MISNELEYLVSEEKIKLLTSGMKNSNLPKELQEVQFRDIISLIGEIEAERKDYRSRVKAVSQPPLSVGEKLLVCQDEEGTWTDEWLEVTVTGIQVDFHLRRPEQPLEPYVLVSTSSDSLKCFNFSLYCQWGKVKRIEKIQS